MHIGIDMFKHRLLSTVYPRPPNSPIYIRMENSAEAKFIRRGSLIVINMHRPSESVVYVRNNVTLCTQWAGRGDAY